MTINHLTLRVTAITVDATDIVSIELRSPLGKELPGFTPGAHIELHLSNGLIRQYSLCNDSREQDRYCVGVGLAPNSRGGSHHIHNTLSIGEEITVSAPRNNFPLVADAPKHVFFAGGIGITPILSMIQWCEANQKDWHLYYLVRSRERAAFLKRLMSYGDKVTLHADDEAGSIFDVKGTVAQQSSDSHFYTCGPAPLMQAVEVAAKTLPSAQVHFEWFAPKVIESPTTNKVFTIKLARSGLNLEVPSNKTILDVLEENDIAVDSSCREGTCATCETTVLAGIPDHRDSVLTESEKKSNSSMMVCVSRSLSEILELDL